MTGTPKLKLQLRRPLRGLRLHPIGGSPTPSPPAVRLIGLQTRAAADSADSAALQQCLSAIEQGLARIPVLVAENLRQVTAIATELGLCLAREIVGEALDRGHVDPVPIVQRCLRSVVRGAEAGEVHVFLSAEDMSTVMSRWQSAQARDELDLASFAVDPALPRGSVRVETGAGSLSYDPREVCERVAATLREETAG